MNECMYVYFMIVLSDSYINFKICFIRKKFLLVIREATDFEFIC